MVGERDGNSERWHPGRELGLSALEIVEPETVTEALGLLDSDDPTVRPVGGGTALMLLMKARVFQPTRLVGLRRLRPQYSGIWLDGDKLRIGALTPLRDMEQSVLLKTHFPVLGQALHTLSNVRVRNVATLGGHLAHADPHMDLPPVLLTLDAEVEVTGPGGVRWIAIEHLLTGYYATSLAGNELLTQVALPLPKAETGNAYSKCTALSADDWPTAGVAVGLGFGSGVLQEARLAVSAATERAMRLKEAEAMLNGQVPSQPLFAAVGDAVAQAVEPTADLRGSRAYKREMVRVYTVRTLHAAVSQLPGTMGGTR